MAIQNASSLRPAVQASASMVAPTGLQTVLQAALQPIFPDERRAASEVMASVPPPTAAQVAQNKENGLVLRTKLEFAIDSADPNAATTIKRLLHGGLASGFIYAFNGMSSEYLSAIVTHLSPDAQSVRDIAFSLSYEPKRSGLTAEAKASLLASLEGWDDAEKRLRGRLE